MDQLPNLTPPEPPAEPERKPLLIIGGAGYIGSHTLLQLARSKQYQLSVFDNLKNGHREALELIQRETGEQISLIVGDLLNADEIANALKSLPFVGVIHFAALIEAGISMEQPTKFFDNNVAGTINLIKAMQAADVRKLVFSSTAAVYGTTEDPRCVETQATHPESNYALSKFMVEEILRALTAENVVAAEKIDSVILRYFNAAGSDPNLLLGQDYPRPTHLITIAAQAALGKREKLMINGTDYPTKDGTCVRDYIHVEDLAMAHVKALDYLQKFNGSEVINVGTGVGSSVLEVVAALEKITGPIRKENGPRRPGDAMAQFADNTKAKQLLGWEPKYTLDDMVQHALNWMKTYQHGFADRIKK